MYNQDYSNEKLKDNIIGSEWWLNSQNLSFSEILIESRVPEKWARFDRLEDEFHNFLLKPVNRYVSNLYPRPQLIDINDERVILRQRTHAEIWVQDEGVGLYALDKTHQRQFYPSENDHNYENCYPARYRFYVPWFIDKDCEANILLVSDEDTPISAVSTKINFKKVDKNSEHVNTNFVDCGIKKEGSWMLDGTHGILPISSAIYDMVIYLNTEELKMMRHQYDME